MKHSVTASTEGSLTALIFGTVFIRWQHRPRHDTLPFGHGILRSAVMRPDDVSTILETENSMVFLYRIRRPYYSNDRTKYHTVEEESRRVSSSLIHMVVTSSISLFFY